MLPRGKNHAHRFHFRPCFAQGGGGGSLAGRVPRNVAQHIQGGSHAGLHPAGGPDKGLQPCFALQVENLAPQLLGLLPSYLCVMHCISRSPAQQPQSLCCQWQVFVHCMGVSQCLYTIYMTVKRLILLPALRMAVLDASCC